jgi:hypothetical protein
MGTFLYFGYGSNLLSEWLGQKARCPSSKSQSIARVDGYALSFDKISVDGSGKATIVKRERATVWGRIFEIEDAELTALDAAEGRGSGYDRIDAFPVAVGSATQTTRTYIGTKLAEAGMAKPYDWYLALVIAGAVQAGLPAEYVGALRAMPWMSDPPPSLSFDRRTNLAAKKKEAVAALQAAGFGSIESILKP